MCMKITASFYQYHIFFLIMPFASYKLSWYITRWLCNHIVHQRLIIAISHHIPITYLLGSGIILMYCHPIIQAISIYHCVTLLLCHCVCTVIFFPEGAREKNGKWQGLARKSKVAPHCRCSSAALAAASSFARIRAWRAAKRARLQRYNSDPDILLYWEVWTFMLVSLYCFAIVLFLYVGAPLHSYLITASWFYKVKNAYHYTCILLRPPHVILFYSFDSYHLISALWVLRIVLHVHDYIT